MDKPTIGKDHTGLKYKGRKVIKYLGVRNYGRSRWLVQCEFCSKTSEIYTTGFNQSCACQVKRNYTHAMTGSPEMASYKHMIQRCTNPNNDKYKDYGGRGIKVCDRWLNDFMAFYQDMGPRPKGKTLDRFPDVNGDYEPSNCRWATPTQQARNLRSHLKQDVGVYFQSNRWRAGIRHNGKNIYLGRFKEKSEAISARKSAEQKYWN